MAGRLASFDQLTEQQINDCIERSRGDLLVAARLLGVRLKDLMEAAEHIDGIKTHLLMVNATRQAEPDFWRMSDEQFSRALKRNKTVYAVDALDEIHKIAMMPLNEDSTAEMVAQKLKACVELASGTPGGGESSELAEVLRELNVLYRESAPRIKSLRLELSVQQGADIPATPTLDLSSPEALPEPAHVEMEGSASSGPDRVWQTEPSLLSVPRTPIAPAPAGLSSAAPDGDLSPASRSDASPGTRGSIQSTSKPRSGERVPLRADRIGE